MTTRTLKVCLQPGCPALVSDRYCQTHKRRREAEDRKRRGTAAARGYDADWKRLRNKYLIAHPLCAHCLRQGRKRMAVMVDHIVPLPEGERLDPANLQSLCASHHATKTANDKAKVKCL